MAIKVYTNNMVLSDKRKVIEKFNQSTRKWYGHALAGMILSDGVIDESELNHLHEILISLEPKEEAIKLVEQVKTKTLPDLSNIDIYDREVCVDILFSLIDIAVSDFKLENSELKYLKLVCARMGFDSVFANKILTFSSEYMKIFIVARDLKILANKYSKSN